MIRVRTDKISKYNSKYFTPGQIYDAKHIRLQLYEVINNIGSPVHIRLDSCGWLDGRAWEIVNETPSS